MSVKYYKVTNLEEVHYGHVYHDGLNMLNGEFANEGSCVPGGFYFTTIDKIQNYYYYGVNIREIELPKDDDFVMVQDGDKWRANKIILGKKWSLFDPATYDHFGLSPYFNHYLMDYASSAGRVDVLELWAKNTSDQDNIWKKHLKEICSDCQYQTSLLPYSHQAIDKASENGHIDVLQWWFNRYIFHGDQFKSSHMAIDRASERGRINVLEWWWWKKVNHDLEFRYHSAIDLASAKGQIDTLEWWFEKALYGQIFTYSTMAVDQAAINQHYHILEWWLVKKDLLDWKVTDRPIIYACQIGCLGILDWFFEKFCLGLINMQYDHTAIDSAISYGHLHVLQWFFDRRSAIPLEYAPHSRLIAVDKNHKHILQWWDDHQLL
jgi:hypothetical protein